MPRFRCGIHEFVFLAAAKKGSLMLGPSPSMTLYVAAMVALDPAIFISDYREPLAILGKRHTELDQLNIASRAL
jgi:hypothetical protein